MAEHLASIFGTEKNRVNCQFYLKIGACRHGNSCLQLHNRPTISPTLLLSHMYRRPNMITPGIDAQGNPIDPQKIQEQFEDFYENIFEMLSKYGEIKSLNVSDNLGNHMIGNVYVQFRNKEQAAADKRGLQGRHYNGRPIRVDFSPVTDFFEVTCYRFKRNGCNKGAYCKFMHVKEIRRDLRQLLYGSSGRSRYSRSRSSSPSYRRDRERSHERGDHRRSSERDRDRERHERRSEKMSRSEGRSRSPVRESSEERRAKIEHWNRKREEKEQKQE